MLLIPLRQGAALLGLCVFGKLAGSEADNFRIENIGSAVMLAQIASPQIQQARLFELEQSRKEVLAHLNMVGGTVVATYESEKIFNLIDESCLKLLNAEVSTLFLVERPGFLSLVSSSGSPPGTAVLGLQLEMRAGPGAGLTGHIAKMGQVFNEHGQSLSSHEAIKNRGTHPHLPSGYCSSLLAVPLKRNVAGKGEIIGLLKVENKKDQNGKVDRANGFTKEDELVLQTLADFAVTAIQNAEHFTFTQALQKVTQVVHSSITDYSEVLNRVLVELRNLIPFNTASIQLLVGEVLQVRACEWNDETEKQNVLKLTFPLVSKFPNDQVIRTRQPLLIDDVRASKYEHFWKEKIYCSSHIRSWMGIPLLFADQAIGMLSIESNEPSFYTVTHLEKVAAFSSQVVSAIKNAELYKSAKSLMELIEDLNKELECGVVLQKIANDAVNKDAFIAADKALIYEYDPDSETFIGDAVYAGGELKKPKLSNPPFKQDSIIFRCTKLTKRHLAPDISRCEVLHGRFTRREEIVSAAVFPLLVDERLVGLMFINYLTYHEFTEQEVSVMELFARHAAIAIQTARQYQRICKKMEVATASARFGRLASTWVHDLQPKTLGIRALVDTLRPRIDPQDQEALERIYATSIEISQVIPDLPPRHNVESVSLSEVFEAVRRKRSDDLNLKKVVMQTEVDNLPAVRGNTLWLIWIFEGLVNNALRFTPPGGTIRIEGNSSSRRLFVDVIDSGPGMPEHLKIQLYTGGVLDPESDGRGLGLLLIKSILNDYDSDIGLPHTDERGNVFTVHLPLAPDRQEKQ